MKAVFVALVLALAVAAVTAECPNMCSSHGRCVAGDMCDCYRNWRGADCSLRTCQFGVAFVTTPNGNLNHNDMIDDPSVNVPVSWSNAKTFESSPDFSDGEAHAYMECSNKGLCNRGTGECDCFAGYEGSACQRTQCPLDCSGHGVCRNIIDLGYANQTPGHESRYPLWDGLKNQACVCDGGYFGSACNKRMCPKGDDSLTTTGVDAVGIISYSDTVSTMAGTFVVEYVDVYGQKWQSGNIIAKNFAAFNNAAQAAAVIENALLNIPNKVFTSVNVVATQEGDNTSTFGTKYTITFSGNPGEQNMFTLKENKVYSDGIGGDVSTFVIVAVTQGTKESAECSNRGSCDYDTGVCACFRGYSGNACSLQNALAF